jgi:hypothetical protein
VTQQPGSAGDGVETDDNDWRVTVRLPEQAQAAQAVEHLSTHQVEAELHGRLGGTVVIGAGDGAELFLYTHARDAAAAAQESVAGVLASHGLKADYSVERWHPVEEEWEAADVPLPQTADAIQAERSRLDAEETSASVAGGVALFEVRVQLHSHRDAVGLAERLTAEGYPVVRRWRFLVAGANNADQAGEFAARSRQEAPADAVVTTEEVGPARPYTPFEIAAGSGL